MSRALIPIILLLLVPPLLLGVINKTKAWFAGRSGLPLLQAYYDIWKLLNKGAVYSKTTSWVFRAGPIVYLSTTLCAALIVPIEPGGSPFGFQGDIIVVAYLLSLGRFFTIAAALDTGSSFEGMGASREATFSALAEPALFLALAVVCIPARSTSFQQVWTGLPWESLGAHRPAYLAAAITLFIVMLAENSRIPVDDPNTHLELTMVHEVMVLDHSGPDLAFITFAGAIKLYVIGSLILFVALPNNVGWARVALFVLAQTLVAVIIGIVESITARFRLLRVPQFLLAASVIAALGLATEMYRGVP